MESLNDRTVVVAGATGDLGPFIVRALLDRQAVVAAPSRSQDKLADLCQHLGKDGRGRLRTFVGDVSDEREAPALHRRIVDEVGTPDAVVASVGDFVPTPSLFEASVADIRRALYSYVIAHLMIARTFLPTLKASGGTYVLLQGPLAFELHPEFGAHLISIGTAGQHMLFRALAQEVDDSPARVVELVVYGLIRDRTTQPGSPVSGEEVGAFTADLLAGAGGHGQSIHLGAA